MPSPRRSGSIDTLLPSMRDSVLMRWDRIEGVVCLSKQLAVIETIGFSETVFKQVFCIGPVHWCERSITANRSKPSGLSLRVEAQEQRQIQPANMLASLLWLRSTVSRVPSATRRIST
jgi:hypothetical protein